MTHSDYSSETTNRQGLAKTTVIRRALAAALLLVLLLSMTGCGLFRDRSLTALVIDDASKIDIKDLLKYENLQQLDVRAASITPEDYLALQATLPNCRISWSVPIAGQRFDNQLTQFTLPAETDGAALDLLRYFPNLSSVDARACSCYDALMSKSIELQNVSFAWQLEIEGVTALNTDTALDLSGKTLDAETLMKDLYYLPTLETVDLTDTNLSEADGAALEARYPNVAFLRTLDIFGVKVNTDATALNLTQANITDDAQLPDLLAPLQSLETCDLTGRTVSFETIAALEERYPLVAFSFTFELFGQTLTPETTELNLQGQTFTSPEEVSEGLKHLPAVTVCDLSGTGLTDEQIAQLQSAFPGVKFVWMVRIGAWQVRTDIEAFSTENHKAFPDGAGMYDGKGNSQLTDEDTAAFRYCTDLVYLDLDGNRITDLAFLQYLPKLRLLSVANNRIKSISPVASLGELEYLEVFINYISELNPLMGLTKLTSLNCSRTALTDITPLLGMKQLKMLWIMNNKIEEEDLDKLTSGLPDCKIVSRGSNATAGGWRDNDLYYEFEVKAGLALPTPSPEPSVTPEPSMTPEPSVTPESSTKP